MDSILHEKQEGSLCAQHCLNVLLQGAYFTAIDLADIARQLDESERLRMAEGGVMTDSYQRFMKQPSSNYDDSGFFSVQVLSNALSVWNLELVPYSSQDPVSICARADPTTQTAYICNFKEHWLTIRKLGFQWFNLNSLLKGPELISDTFLSLFLVQLQQEGYSIFIVKGVLPDCEADQLLKLIPAVQPIKPGLISDKSSRTTSSHSGINDDDEMQKALSASQQAAEDEEFQKALQMSLEGHQHPAQTSSALTSEELRQRRIAYLASTPGSSQGQPTGEATDDSDLQAAIRMSLQSQ